MPQTTSEVIAQCPNPKCQKPILADHDSPWCFSCGEYFPENVVAQIPKLQKKKAAAEAYRDVHGGSTETAVINRYRDAYRVGAALLGLGTIIKVVGLVLAGIIVVGSLSVSSLTEVGIVLAAIVGGLFWSSVSSLRRKARFFRPHSTTLWPRHTS